MSNQSKKDDKFYQKWIWAVWFSAADVQRLEMAAKGLWFEMIGLMWDSEERGYLVNNGKPLTRDQVYLSIRGFRTRKAFNTAFEAIKNEGLFSVRETDGALYSRKILSDLAKSAEKAVNGRKGGLASQGTSSNRSSNRSSYSEELAQAQAQAIAQAKALAEKIAQEIEAKGGQDEGS